jgi:hypothetical protein
MPDYWPNQPYYVGTSSNIWIDWNTTRTTTSSQLVNGVWPEWTATTASHTVYPSTPWNDWNRTSALWHTPRRQAQFWSSQPLPPQLDAKALWKRDRQSAIRQRRLRVAGMRKRVAQRKAEALLLDNLDAQQLAEWTAHKHFHVETADGTKTYRISLGLAGNIYLVRDGDRRLPSHGYLRRYCFHEYHPDGAVPQEDNVLAQKLVIEAAHDFFLAQANPA